MRGFLKPALLRVQTLLAAVVFFASTGGLFAGRLAGGLQHAVKDVRLLADTGRSERLLGTYGDRDIMGFGYLLQLVSPLPDKRLFPKVRYHYYSMNQEIVFPGDRAEVSDDVLIGIDVDSEDLIETAIGKASRLSSRRADNRDMSGWAFVTDWEYDRISGIRLRFKGAFTGARKIGAVLLASPSDPTVLGEWGWREAAPSGDLTLGLEPPLKDQYGRGSLPYVLFLQIEGEPEDPAAEVEAVEILGVKVSLEGYTPIHLEKNCFAALKTSFLDEIFQDRREEWLRYLLEVSNVDEVRRAAAAAFSAAPSPLTERRVKNGKGRDDP